MSQVCEASLNFCSTDRTDRTRYEKDDNFLLIKLLAFLYDLEEILICLFKLSLFCSYIFIYIVILVELFAHYSHNLSSCSLESFILYLLVFHYDYTASDTQLLCLTYCSFEAYES